MSILLCIFQQNGSAPRWSAWRPLVYLGKISYGLYVYHVLAINLSLRLFAEHTKSWAGFASYWLTALLITVALAAISYRCLEAPFLRLKQRFTEVESRPV
jgi:peptidoglycan/LPS O-acetylase OafA/YrhL